MFGRALLPGGESIEFGTAALTQSYDPDWREPGPHAKNTIGLELDSPAAVDELYLSVTALGHAGQLAPCDPPWGARFAIVLDPDGNQIGLHSPRDRNEERRREGASDV